jgi:hypothetical protein
MMIEIDWFTQAEKNMNEMVFISFAAGDGKLFYSGIVAQTLRQCLQIHRRQKIARLSLPDVIV